MYYLNMVYGFKYVFFSCCTMKEFDLDTAANSTVFRMERATDTCTNT